MTEVHAYDAYMNADKEGVSVGLIMTGWHGLSGERMSERN